MARLRNSWVLILHASVGNSLWKTFFFLTFFCLFFSNKQIHINMGATYIHINTTIHEVITIKTKFKYKFGL